MYEAKYSGYQPMDLDDQLNGSTDAMDVGEHENGNQDHEGHSTGQKKDAVNMSMTFQQGGDPAGQMALQESP